MVINLALPLLDESTHMRGEANNIVKKTLCQCQFRLGVFPGTKHAETASTWLLCASPIHRNHTDNAK
jgi:hypothetical protein